MGGDEDEEDFPEGQESEDQMRRWLRKKGATRWLC